MSYWLYQGLTEPVQATPAADVSTYAWRNDWREPVRRPFATALIVAAATISPWALTQPEATTIDRYYRPFSEPVRKKPGLDVSRQSVLAWSSFTPAPDVVNTGWLPPWSEPVRLKRRVADFPFAGPIDVRPRVSFGWYGPFGELRVPERSAQQQQYLAWSTFTPSAVVLDMGWWPQPWIQPRGPKSAQQQQALAWGVFTPAAQAQIHGWLPPWSEPVRIKRRVSDFPFTTTDTRPRVSFGWYEPLSEPKRFKRGLLAASQPVWTGPINPTVSFGWYGRLHDPVRVKPRLHAALNPFGAMDTRPAVSFGWYGRLTEPVRQKPGLKVNLQRFTEFDPFPIPNPGIIAWYGELSSPVRLPIGLKAPYQVAYVSPPRVLPNPVFVTMAATEENGDIFSAGLNVYKAANTAVVSIEEIEVPGNAATSIREP